MDNEETKPARTVEVEAIDSARTGDHSSDIAELQALEDGMTLWQAVRFYIRPVIWACWFALANVSGGFDSQVANNILAVPSFRKTFGDPAGFSYVVPTLWLQLFNTLGSFGGFLGALTCGWMADAFGRRLALFTGLLLITIGCIIEVSTTSRAVFTVAKVIFGYGLGFNIAVAPMYTSEVSPTVLRGAVVAALNLSVIIGQLLSNSVIRGFGTRTDLWAFRAPLLFQLLFPLLIAPGIFIAPESPWWLVRKGKVQQARKELRRLYGESYIEARLHNMVQTIQHEAEWEGISYLACFKGLNLRRTMVCLGGFICQHFTGVIFVLGYSTYFFELAGLPVSASLSLGVGTSACGLVANCLSIYLLSRYGRRNLYIYGMVCITICLFIIGIMTEIHVDSAKWVQGSFTIIYEFFYSISIGALAYVMLVEASSSMLRAKTSALAGATQQCMFILMYFIIPFMINPTAGNLGGRVGYVFGGLSLLCTIWSFWAIPELKNLTFSQVDILFENRVPAWETARYFDHAIAHSLTKQDSSV